MWFRAKLLPTSIQVPGSIFDSLATFIKFHSHPFGFYWGHQCSWTQPSSMQVSIMKSNNHNPKLPWPCLGQGLNRHRPRSLGGWWCNQVPTYLGQSLHWQFWLSIHWTVKLKRKDDNKELFNFAIMQWSWLRRTRTLSWFIGTAQNMPKHFLGFLWFRLSYKRLSRGFTFLRWYWPIV